MALKKQKTFEDYFQELYPQAKAYTIKKTGSFEAAEDLVMDAFYSCFEKWDQFDPERATFSTWLYVVLKNKIKNYYRDHRTFNDVEEEDPADESFEDDIVEAYYLAEMRDSLAEALSILNETQRRIVILKYFKNKTSVEIAEELFMTSGNVRVQLTRSLKKMRDALYDKGIRWEG